MKLLRPILPLALITLALPVLAQTAPTNDTTSIGTTDAETIAIEKKVNASYYHPIGVAEYDCDAKMDWESFFHLAGIDPDSDKAKALRATVFHLEAERGKPISFDETWSKEAMDLLPIELRTGFGSSVHQMVAGFFKSYWAMMDTSLASDKGVVHSEKMPDCGYKLYGTYQAMEAETITTADFLPVRSKLKGSLQTVSLALGFSPSPTPTETDRMRLTSLEATQSMGINSTTGQLHFDYQDVRGFHMPKTLSLSVPGAFMFTFELVGCKVRLDSEKKPEPSVTTTQTIRVRPPSANKP